MVGSVAHRGPGSVAWKLSCLEASALLLFLLLSGYPCRPLEPLNSSTALPVVCVVSPRQKPGSQGTPVLRNLHCQGKQWVVASSGCRAARLEGKGFGATGIVQLLLVPGVKCLSCRPLGSCCAGLQGAD